MTLIQSLSHIAFLAATTISSIGHSQQTSMSKMGARDADSSIANEVTAREIPNSQLVEFALNKQILVVAGDDGLPDILVLVPAGYSLNRSSHAGKLKNRFADLLLYLAGENTSGSFLTDDCLLDPKSEVYQSGKPSNETDKGKGTDEEKVSGTD